MNNTEDDIQSESYYKIEKDTIKKYYKNYKKAFKYSKIIYEKLFIGDYDYYNYKRKKKYKIRWSNSELRMLSRIMKCGIEFFENNIEIIDTNNKLEKLLSVSID